MSHGKGSEFNSTILRFAALIEAADKGLMCSLGSFIAAARRLSAPAVFSKTLLLHHAEAGHTLIRPARSNC